MAIFRSLNTLIGRKLSRSRPFLTLLSIAGASQSASTCAAILSPPPPPLLFRNTPFLLTSHSRLLSPLSKLILFPFHGPLFLSSPPWKLSQSATPLHIQGHVVLYPNKLHALSLLQRTAVRFPIKLRLVKTAYLEKEKAAPITFIGSGLAESFINLPNLVSLSRMVSGPVLGWMIINEWYAPAFVGLIISGATDWLDGFLARKMGINSVVGSYLDPLADKVLIGCVAIAMVENNLLHPGLVGLVVLRDVLLVGGAVYNRASSLDWKWKSLSDFINLDGTRPEKVEPLFISKVNTVFQLILVGAALLQPELGTTETQTYINYLSWLVGGTTVASTAGYGAQHMRMRSRSLPTIRGMDFEAKHAVFTDTGRSYTKDEHREVSDM